MRKCPAEDESIHFEEVYLRVYLFDASRANYFSEKLDRAPNIKLRTMIHERKKNERNRKGDFLKCPKKSSSVLSCD